MFAIRAMRERSGLKQQEVADMLGVPRTRFGNWENEYRSINFSDACRLADIFGCTLDELAGRTPPNSENRNTLTPNESAIIDAYRSANATGRIAVEAVAQSVRGDEQGIGPQRVENRAG